MAGRPKFQPTDEQRKTVRAMVAYGVPLEDVASVIGIDRKTLSKHFPEEIANAAAEANAKVAQALYRQAVEQGNTTAQIFWLKTKAGWREKYEVEHSGGLAHKFIAPDQYDEEGWESQQKKS